MFCKKVGKFINLLESRVGERALCGFAAYQPSRMRIILSDLMLGNVYVIRNRKDDGEHLDGCREASCIFYNMKFIAYD